MRAFISEARRFDDPIAVINASNPDALIADLERLRTQTLEIERALSKKYGVKRNELYKVEDNATPLEAEFLFQSALDVQKIDDLLSLLQSPHDEIDLRFEGQKALQDLSRSDSFAAPDEIEKFAIARLIAFNKAALERGQDFETVLKDLIRARAERIAGRSGEIDPDDFDFMVRNDLNTLKRLFGEGDQPPAKAVTAPPQKALPPPTRESSVEAFDDPLAPAAKGARDAEIAAALDEIDPDPEARLVTGAVDVDADGRILARTETRADLEAEFAADAAIVARLKGCVA